MKITWVLYGGEACFFIAVGIVDLSQNHRSSVHKLIIPIQSSIHEFLYLELLSDFEWPSIGAFSILSI